MKIKIGKYKNCQKKLKSYGFTEVEASIICSKVAIGDTDWEVNKKEEEVSKFETEETEEEEEVAVKRRKKVTPAGGKAIKKERGKERPIHTEPKAMQMPLYQPWRSYKSEHRLQTKLEKVQTAEQKFLTMEQLLKRAEYALAIKKKDAEPFMVYSIPEELWDQTQMSGMGGTGKTVKEGPYAGQPIIGWFRTGGGQSIPMIATASGPKNIQAAEKEGIKPEPMQVPSISEKLKERGRMSHEQKVESKAGIEFASPRTQKEAAAERSHEKDKALTSNLENLEQKTQEPLSGREKLEQAKESKEGEEKALNKAFEELKGIDKENLIRQKIEVAKIELSPSFNTLGADLRNQNLQWERLNREDLWSHLHNDLNWTTEGKNEEYDQIFMRIGKAPFVHHQNPLNQMEAIKNMKPHRENDLVLHDFIAHTLNYYLKEAAHKQLKKNNPEYYRKEISSKMKGQPAATKKSPTTYGYNTKSGGNAHQNLEYEKQKHEYELREYERGLYEAQRGAAMFQGDRDRSEKDIKTLLEEERRSEVESDNKFKIQPPDATLEELGLLEKMTVGTDDELMNNKETKEWEERNRMLTKAITGTEPLTSENEYESVYERAKEEGIGRWKGRKEDQKFAKDIKEMQTDIGKMEKEIEGIKNMESYKLDPNCGSGVVSGYTATIKAIKGEISRRTEEYKKSK